MRQVSQPLFRFDPGWLFLAAGLAVMAACILLPPADDLDGLARQRDALAERERAVATHLASYTGFLAEVQDPDPQLIQRLVECELNQVPSGRQAVLMSAGGPIGALGWLQEAGASHGENELAIDPASAKQSEFRTTYSGIVTLGEDKYNGGEPRSMLQRIAASEHRLWVLGASGLCIFLGLMTSMPTVRVSQKIHASRVRHQAQIASAKASKTSPSLMACRHVVAAVHGPIKSRFSKTNEMIDAVTPETVAEPVVLEEESSVESICPPADLSRKSSDDQCVISVAPQDVDQQEAVEDDQEWEYEYVEEFVDADEDEEEAWDDDAQAGDDDEGVEEESEEEGEEEDWEEDEEHEDDDVSWEESDESDESEDEDEDGEEDGEEEWEDEDEAAQWDDEDEEEEEAEVWEDDEAEEAKEEDEDSDNPAWSEDDEAGAWDGDEEE